MLTTRKVILTVGNYKLVCAVKINWKIVRFLTFTEYKMYYSLWKVLVWLCGVK